MRLKGNVSSIVDFGAFVDLGGIDGLVHISELSWNHVNHPSEVVKVGDEVEVEVLDVDLQRERISRVLKQTTPDPGIQLVENYPVGTIVDGKVTKIVPFGAFVELGDSIEGLVHISEMAGRHIDTPAPVSYTHLMGEKDARTYIKAVMDDFIICSVDYALCRQAADSDEPDFEDGLVRACAENARVDFIVTRDVTAFARCV